MAVFLVLRSAGVRSRRNILIFYLQTDLKMGLSEDKARDAAQSIIRREKMKREEL